KESLLLTDVANHQTRQFIFHPYDRENVYEDSFKWVSPGFLSFEGQQAALINAQTLKMNFPVPKTSGVALIEFSPNFKLALGARDDGPYLGKVMLPEISAAR